MNKLAIVVPHTSSPPPPPAPASPQAQQQECKYSAKVAGGKYDPVYQCFSQEEWDARNAQIAQQKAAESKKFKQATDNFVSNPWVIGVFWVIIVIIVIVIVKKLINWWRYGDDLWY